MMEQAEVSILLQQIHAVEHKMKIYTSDTPQCIKLAMISAYKLDKL